MSCDFFIKRTWSIRDVIIILSMVLCTSGRVLVSLKYTTKHGRLYQSLDYIDCLRYGIGFYFALYFWKDE